MDEKETVTWGGFIITTLGFAGTWAAMIFGGGSRYGSLKEQVDAQGTDIEEIKKLFKTADGEPRLVSFAAFRHMRDECQQHILSEVDHAGSAVTGIKEDVKEIGKKVDKVLQQQAILMAERECNEL